MDKALIVGMNMTAGADPNRKKGSFDLAMDEMVSLVKACDMEPVGRIEQNIAEYRHVHRCRQGSGSA